MLLVHKSTLDKIDSKSVNANYTETQRSFDEGARISVIKELSYRSTKVVMEARMKYGVKCKVCEFDFGDTYGEHGNSFIEMHHLKPISLGKRKTTANDLRPVCANCHRMLHRGDKLLTIEELRKIITETRKVKANLTTSMV